MAKKKKYHSISAFLAVAISIIIHYFLISNINMHPTIHATLGIFLFFIFVALILELLNMKRG